MIATFMLHSSCCTFSFQSSKDSIVHSLSSVSVFPQFLVTTAQVCCVNTIMTHYIKIMSDILRCGTSSSALIDGDVHLFDSSFQGQLTASTELQILQMYRPLIAQHGLLVTVDPIQQQEEGSNNCGLFSIAAAYHVAKGDDITAIIFNEKRMRSHLVQCFERQKFTAFPKSRMVGGVGRPELQHICIAVHCSCQQPDSFDQMIQCDKCDTWYHYRCAKVKKAPLGDWYMHN